MFAIINTDAACSYSVIFRYTNTEVYAMGKQYNARVKRQRSRRRIKRKKRILREKLAKKY